MRGETSAHLCAIRVERPDAAALVVAKEGGEGEGHADRALNSSSVSRFSPGTRQMSRLNRPIAAGLARHV